MSIAGTVNEGVEVTPRLYILYDIRAYTLTSRLAMPIRTSQSRAGIPLLRDASPVSICMTKDIGAGENEVDQGLVADVWPGAHRRSWRILTD